MRNLKPEERIIVAADFKEEHAYNVTSRIEKLANILKDTGVYIKVNSALRLCGYSLIELLHSYGLKVFADLKLFDISATLETDGVLLKSFRPELLTVACVSGLESMSALKAQLPGTEVLGVTVLTSHNVNNVRRIYGEEKDVPAQVVTLAHEGVNASIDGFISSPKEASLLRNRFGNRITINTPGIRPHWSIVIGDDQNLDRITTPQKALVLGADRIVIGRPIIQAENPYDAVMRTIDEIASATA